MKRSGGQTRDGTGHDRYQISRGVFFYKIFGDPSSSFTVASVHQCEERRLISTIQNASDKTGSARTSCAIDDKFGEQLAGIGLSKIRKPAILSPGRKINLLCGDRIECQHHERG